MRKGYPYSRETYEYDTTGSPALTRPFLKVFGIGAVIAAIVAGVMGLYALLYVHGPAWIQRLLR